MLGFFKMAAAACHGGLRFRESSEKLFVWKSFMLFQFKNDLVIKVDKSDALVCYI